MKIIPNYHIHHDKDVFEPEEEYEVEDKLAERWIEKGSARRPMVPADEASSTPPKTRRQELTAMTVEDLKPLMGDLLKPGMNKGDMIEALLKAEK